MARLCIIGCGLTGAITASLLKQTMPHVQVVILEKSKGTGGRFCTSRSPFGSCVDLGAQFIAKSTSLSEVQKKCYSQLLETGLLQPLQESVEGLKDYSKGTENFICTQGSGSVVKHFLQIADCDTIFEHRAAKLSLGCNKWNVSCENNSEFEFDAVIVTVPVPQVFQLEGILPYLKEKEFENLKSVAYSSRFALGLYYDRHLSYFDNIPWVAKYISDNDVLRFCSLDHKKRNSSSLPSIAVHTTKEFGKMHIDDNDMSSVKEIILNSLEKILPGCPEPSFIKFHKWRYSQVESAYNNKPGCIILSKAPPLIVGGDGFSSSTFEGCVNASENIVKHISMYF